MVGTLTGRGARLVLAATAGVLICASAASAGSALPKDVARKLKRYNTKYYTIYSDLDTETVREAAARVTAMALEYRARTKGFARTIRKRLPFLLFGNREDYYKAGAPRGSAGVFMGDRLMAIASERMGDRVWGIVQHEGFHQFAFYGITRRLPIWVNEGLAEYFATSVWTGDGFVAGIIPPGRMRRVRGHIENDRILPFLAMLKMEQRTWNAGLSVRNYDQAWSMVHFLVHAEDGKYRKALSRWISDIARRKPWANSFIARFGRNTKAFQQRYAAWWNALPADPTAEKRVQVVVQTLTSYLGRATSQGQQFKDAGAFFAAARAGELKAARRQWLPKTLLDKALSRAEKLDGWSLDLTDPKRPKLVLARPDGARLTGAFGVVAGRVANVKVDLVKPVEKEPTTQAAQK